MNANVRDFIANLNYLLLTFGFIDYNISKQFDSLGISFDYNQPNTYLNQINLNSGSGIVNIFLFLWWVCIIISTHICLFLWSLIIPKDKSEKCCSKWILKAFERMTFGWYFTYIAWGFLPIILASVSEICRFNISGSKQIISLSLSIMFFFLYFECCIFDLLFINGKTQKILKYFKAWSSPNNYLRIRRITITLDFTLSSI